MNLSYLISMIRFIKFTTVWISQNLAIPFWTIGHVHLMTSVYADIHEVLMSLGMNIIVFVGFIINFIEDKK
jgi:hypothetical protein